MAPLMYGGAFPAEEAAIAVTELTEFGEVLLVPIQLVAIVATIGQYLSPYPIIKRIVRQNTTGNFSRLPYLANFVNACVATFYGFHVRNTFLMMLNSFGITVSAGFLFTYQQYSPLKTRVLLEMLMYTIIILGMCFATAVLEHHHGRVLLGTVQNFATVAGFVSPLSTLRVVFEHRSSESIPFILVVMNALSSLSWFAYGVILNDWFLEIPNFLGMVLSAYQLSLFVRFPPQRFHALG
jgi:solute carrier family 50 protein (sugar transporter)